MKWLLTIAVAAVLVAHPRHEDSCAKIKGDFHESWGNFDDYVQSYTRAQRRHVIACLRTIK